METSNTLEINKQPMLEDVYIRNVPRLILPNKKNDVLYFFSSYWENLKKSAESIQKTEDSILLHGLPGTGKHSFTWLMSAVSDHPGEIEFFNCETPKFHRMFLRPSGRLPKQAMKKKSVFQKREGLAIFENFHVLPYQLQWSLLKTLQKNKSHSLRYVFMTNIKDLSNWPSKNLSPELLRQSQIIELKEIAEREDEILPFAGLFLKMHERKHKKPGLFFSKEVEEMLLRVYWKDNLHGINAAIEKMVVLTRQKEINLNISSYCLPTNVNRDILPIDDFDLPENPFDLKKFVLSVVKKALIKHNGKKANVERYLYLTRSELRTYEKFLKGE